jgi:PPIC-type PPIASE domain
MRNKYPWITSLAFVTLSAFLASENAAQQPAAPPKPAEGGSSAPTPIGQTTAIPQAAASSQKVVLRVGTTQVTESEVDFLVMGQAKAIVNNEGLRSVGDEYVKMLLLSRQALDEHLDSSPALRYRLEFVRDQALAGAEYQKMASEVRVGQEEVSQYFSAHQSDFEAVEVREFLIRKRPKDSQDPNLGLTAEEAKAKAESIRQALLAGTDIEKVAKDLGTPTNAVMLIDPKPRAFRREQMLPALAKATFGVQETGVSEPVETSQAFIVIKVFGHQHPELKEVATEIETKLREQKLAAEIDGLRKKAVVWMDEDYFKPKPAATPASAIQPPYTVKP